MHRTSKKKPAFLLILGLGSILSTAAVAQGELRPSMHLSIDGDYVAKGVGLEGTERATIVIDSVPEGAEVVGGVLYWGFLGFSRPHAYIAINGVRLQGTPIGSGSDCFRTHTTYAYRALLSAEQLAGVTADPVGGAPPPFNGNQPYVLSGYPNQSPTIPQGATLVLVYSLDGARTRDLVIYDGNLVPRIWPPPPFFYDTPLFLEGFAAEAPVEASSTFVVGNGDPRGQDLPHFRSLAGQFRVIGFSPLDSSDGPSWDTETVDLDGALEPGDDAGTAVLRVYPTRTQGGLYFLDCMFWVAQITSVTTSRPPDPDPGAAFEDSTRIALGR